MMKSVQLLRSLTVISTLSLPTWPHLRYHARKIQNKYFSPNLLRDPPSCDNLSFVQAAIDLILSSLAVTSSDYLIDLGCGVGSINVTAATQYGVTGLGVDIDPDLVGQASKAAEEAGVDHLVTFRQEDVADTDLSQATTVVSFLVPRHLKSLKQKLLTFLDSGGKIACYHYPITGVTPHDVIELKQGHNKYIYIYKHL